MELSRSQRLKERRKAKKRKWLNRLIAWLVIPLLLVSGTVLFKEEILTGIGAFLVVERPLQKADVIVVFGGAEKLERLSHAVQLYRQGYAEKIFLSGGIGKYPKPISWAFRMKEQAVKWGIPPERIILDEKAESTYDNARNTVQLFKEQGFRSGILVTSPYHMRRSLWTLEHLTNEQGSAYQWIPSPTTNSPFHADNWWKNAKMRDLVLEEYAKMIGYWVLY